MINKFAGFYLSLAALLLVGCNNNQTPEGSDAKVDSVETTKVLQKINVATESSYKPFSYTDSSGKLIGFEIDLMNALCAQMRTQCTITSQEFDGLIPGLTTKKFDAAIAAMSITPDRLEVVDFTDPYYHTGLVFIAKKDDSINIDTMSGDMTVGVQRSTVSDAYLEDGYPDVNIKRYDTHENAYLDLASGRVRAVLTDKIPAIEWLNTAKNAHNFEVKGDEISTDGDALGIAVRKGDALTDKFNTALAELKANGQYDTIAAPYFQMESTAAANETSVQMAKPSINAVTVNEGAANKDTVIEGEGQGEGQGEGEMSN